MIRLMTPLLYAMIHQARRGCKCKKKKIIKQIRIAYHHHLILRLAASLVLFTWLPHPAPPRRAFSQPRLAALVWQLPTIEKEKVNREISALRPPHTTKKAATLVVYQDKQPPTIYHRGIAWSSNRRHQSVAEHGIIAAPHAPCAQRQLCVVTIGIKQSCKQATIRQGGSSPSSLG